MTTGIKRLIEIIPTLTYMEHKMKNIVVVVGALYCISEDRNQIIQLFHV